MLCLFVTNLLVVSSVGHKQVLVVFKERSRHELSSIPGNDYPAIRLQDPPGFQLEVVRIEPVKSLSSRNEVNARGFETGRVRVSIDTLECWKAAEDLLGGCPHSGVRFNTKHDVAIGEEEFGELARARPNVSYKRVRRQVALTLQELHDLPRITRAVFDVVVDATGESLYRL